MQEWDVDGLMEAMPAPVFLRWAAYQEVEPWDETRADLRAGIIASVTANAWRGKGGKFLSPQDFMPKFDGKTEPKPQTGSEMSLAAMTWCAAMGGTIKTSSATN